MLALPFKERQSKQCKQSAFATHLAGAGCGSNAGANRGRGWSRSGRGWRDIALADVHAGWVAVLELGADGAGVDVGGGALGVALCTDRTSELSMLLKVKADQARYCNGMPAKALFTRFRRCSYCRSHE